MPEQLLGRIIRVSSSPGELVLDPFAGSGTTLAVAKKLGRRWLGIELSPDYAQKIKERLAGINMGDPLVGPADPVRSAPKTSNGKKKGRLGKNGQPLPQGDQDTKNGIIAAYGETCGSVSTDQMLCDPELNAAFVHACKNKSLPGDAFVWNRLLLRIRKSGELPKGQSSRQRISFAAMDSYSYASEIAMHLMALDYGLALDDILCRPTAALEFDRIAARFAPGHTAFEYRWAALAIRKRATKSKELAMKQFPSWLTKKLPPAMPLSRCTGDEYNQPGVYVLDDGEHPLYVGETFSLQDRVGTILEAPCWSDLKATSVRFVRNDDQSAHGLQSLLIHRVNPFLNSNLLRPRIESVE
jgi:site-specific DNA-methyltransferase (adenine-specific)